MFFLIKVFALILTGWHLLSALVGAFFGNILLGIMIGDSWMILSVLFGLLLGAAIREANREDDLFVSRLNDNRYAVRG